MAEMIVCESGCAAVHWGAGSSNEGCAGRRTIGQIAKGRRSHAGEAEEGNWSEVTRLWTEPVNTRQLQTLSADLTDNTEGTWCSKSSVFSRSEVIDTVTHLYNAMEEQVHILARKSNMSLQHLDFLLQLREMESRFAKVESCKQKTNEKV